MGAVTLPTYTGRKEADLANYLANHLIGSIQIPKIRISVPLFDHASPTILQYGAGVLEETSYPTGGKNNHSVISAHSGIPERKLFTDLDQLELEDIFIITYAEEKLAYEVNDITIVTPDDVSSLKNLSRGRSRDFSHLYTVYDQFPSIISQRTSSALYRRTSPKRSECRTKTMVAQSHDLTHFIALCRKSIPVHSASHT